MAETLKITSTAPKRYNLSKSPRGVKLINATNTWVNYTAKVVGGCNGSVFEFSISALRSASSLTVTVVKTGTFNSSSYGLFKDDTGVYFVCKNTSGVNDDFLINSSQPIEGPKDIDTSSMTEMTPS